jgi:hypothetical protein
MLLIVVPLLAVVGFIATSGEAAKTSTRYLNYVRTQRGPRLYADGRAMGSWEDRVAGCALDRAGWAFKRVSMQECIP